MTLSITSLLGYHTTRSLLNTLMEAVPSNERSQAIAGMQKITKEDMKKRINGIAQDVMATNIQNALGYIPLVGIYSGYQRIKWMVQQQQMNDTDENKASCATLIIECVRAVFEILGAGVLFLIPDLVVSCHRHFCAKQLLPNDLDI